METYVKAIISLHETRVDEALRARAQHASVPRQRRSWAAGRADRSLVHRARPAQ